MAGSGDSGDEVVRHFIDVATTNSNSSIKSVWLILFTAGTISALAKLNIVLIQLGFVQGVQNPELQSSYPIASLILFIIYFMTFFRFYVGDIRIFDIRYTEIFKILNKHLQVHGTQSHDKKGLLEFLKFQDQNIFKFESLYLVFQTLIIVYLAYQITSPIDFLKVYALLMLINALWLTFSNLRFSERTSALISDIFPGATKSHSFQSMFPRKAGWFWATNNFLTAIGIGLCILFFTGQINVPASIVGSLDPVIFLEFAVGLTLFNCVIDLHMARDFYFPRFADLYESQASIPEEPTVAEQPDG